MEALSKTKVDYSRPSLFYDREIEISMRLKLFLHKLKLSFAFNKISINKLKAEKQNNRIHPS